MARFRPSTVIAACILALSIPALTGCEDAVKNHKTIREEQYGKWNMTRVGVMYQLAEQQYETQDYDKCEATLKEALAVDAPNAPLRILAAKVDIEKGALEAAAAHLKEAIRIDSTSPEPFYLLGVVYQRWQNADVACDYYQQAWDRKSSDVRYLMAVVEMKISLGKLDDAKKVLEDKLVYFEQSGAVRVALARIAVLQDDHATACKYYRDAVLLMPEEVELKRSYSQELYYAGKYSESASAMEDLRKVGEPEERVNILIMLGDAYMHLHRPLDARNCLQEATFLNPNQTTAFTALAKACIETSDYSISAAAARKVLKLEPANVEAHLLLGLAQQKLHRWLDAVDTFRKAEVIAPANVTVLCMLGMSLQQAGRYEQASVPLNKVMTIDPDNSWARQLLASTPKKAANAS